MFINLTLRKSDYIKQLTTVTWICFVLFRIVDATLSGALIAITSDRSKLADHYERDAPILCQTSVDRIIQGAKCLDEMDAESLAEIQISAIVSSKVTF
jgi:hypothetical protein